jgi:hypothetical protein
MAAIIQQVISMYNSEISTSDSICTEYISNKFNL